MSRYFNPKVMCAYQRCIASAWKKGLAVLMLITSTAFAQTATESREAVAWQWVQSEKTLLIDVRTPAEFNQGSLNKAINIPHQLIGSQIANITTDKEQKIVVFCRSGNRSRIAQQILQAQGYQQVHNGGGYQDLVIARPSMCESC